MLNLYPEHTAGLILRGFTNMYWHKEFEDCAIRAMNPQRLENRMYSSVGLNYLKDTEKQLSRAYTKKLKSKNKKTRKKYLKLFNDTSDHHITSKVCTDSYTDMMNAVTVYHHYLMNDWF